MNRLVENNSPARRIIRLLHVLGLGDGLWRKKEAQSLWKSVGLRLGFYVFTFFRFFSVRARLGEGLFLAVGDEVLADLDGVEGSAFLDLVATEPEGQAVVTAGVDADASHINGILA